MEKKIYAVSIRKRKHTLNRIFDLNWELAVG